MMHNMTFVSKRSRSIAIALRNVANVGVNLVLKAVTLPPGLLAEIHSRLIAVNRTYSHLITNFPRLARRMRPVPQLTTFRK
jgi:hypothetical protein